MSAKKMPPRENNSDKRTSNRQELQLLISYNLDGKTHAKFSFDLSSGGMFIESITPPECGTKITVLFELPHNKLNFKIDAIVTRIKKADESVDGSPTGMGVKFIIDDISLKKKLELATNYFKDFQKKA